jgi:hypothetical protein
MTVKTKKIIMVELVETNVFSRWHCTVCDGCTNPVSVLAEGKDGKRAIRVCEQAWRPPRSTSAWLQLPQRTNGTPHT